MKMDVSRVKMYAWMNATRISRSMMKSDRSSETGIIDTPKVVLTAAIRGMRSSSVVMTMWPASMFAKSRIMSAKGFVNMEMISTGIMMGRSHAGSPGGTMPMKWCTTPYFEIPAHCWARNEIVARASVTARFPVEVAENGMSPSSAATRMKKKNEQG